MKFNFCLASENDYREPIEISSLEELLQIVKDHGESIIIEDEGIDGWTIIVYDDYIE